ncbi:glycosyltransferase family 2 protein [Bifidobacterium pseudocatenulatum]|uniref:glycosyltransferase family 2 protein n=1 Tax=Bifidobacterium pseudocatenulatum TaxID=28026 RepID=UPI000E4FBE85|nr:glycosyltransferase family 2 protein [Bifidobacterium pseudocatenulatum]RGW26907.1 glycosyltransferase family 2 protein [Bifidobacterium pseudocatenulatum]RGW30359.1 glycosyltransferase family 2 protein [Bifidobacterium pseudocatenulatum]RGW53156.1 glycosyltransferase family 2 protein [Bifidobacterium pseudocatenulatum]
MQEKKTLTFVVPAYNMTEYLERCVMSLIAAKRNDDIEVLIVDDGSSDGTLEMAQKFEARYPGIVRAIHQENKGHGGAVNTGIAAASGMYVKVVDADDWVGPESLEQVMAVLREEADSTEPIDMLVTNYVYDKVSKRNKHVVNFRHAMKAGERLAWNDLGHFGLAEYILMHALTYRTAVVRESGMQLPEHTFYVDFIYAYQPFPWVKTMKYLDTPFYHYFIGRDGQSVQTDVMIRRVDQLRLVNQCMVRATPERGTVPDGLYRYMIHFLAIESSVASVFMILSRDPENYEKKKDMWDDIKAYSPTIYKDVRKKAMSRALNLRGSIGRFVIRKGYFVAEHVVGFN